jgi:hypothetical protein
MFNQSSMVIYTCVYVARPDPAIAQPMLTPADRNHDRVADLRLLDFMPTAEDHESIVQAFKWMIWEAFEDFATKTSDTIPKCKYSYPEKYRLNHKHRTEIMPLPTFDLNEGIINDVIQIISKIGEKIGLTDHQIQTAMILFKGDLATVLNDRYASFRHTRG